MIFIAYASIHISVWVLLVSGFFSFFPSLSICPLSEGKEKSIAELGP